MAASSNEALYMHISVPAILLGNFSKYHGHEQTAAIPTAEKYE
jgi:hypothetical protein